MTETERDLKIAAQQGVIFKDSYRRFARNELKNEALRKATGNT